MHKSEAKVLLDRMDFLYQRLSGSNQLYVQEMKNDLCEIMGASEDEIRRQTEPYRRQRIEIPMTSGKTLVAEKNVDPDYKEIFVFLEDEGVVVQDLAIVGEEYVYDEGLNTISKPKGYYVKVYSGQLPTD